MDAFISHYLGIPHPELLDEDTWQDKAGQAIWLHELKNPAN
jgi:hypothetical protein